MPTGNELSQAEGRRIALAAQGFSGRRTPSGPVRTSHLHQVADRLGIIQIDSVNVLARSHYLPFFSRLGPYDPSLLDAMRDGDRDGHRALVEYWGHEASLITPRLWPYFGFRMRRAHQDSWGGMRRVAAEHPQLVEAVRREIVTAGPMTARECEAALAHEEGPRRQLWGWNWSLVKAACEHLFWAGDVASAGRTAQFERRYADPAVVLPPQVQGRGPRADAAPSDQESFVALVEVAAQAHGLGTARCLRDYARLSSAQAGPALAHLVDEGRLIPVRLEGDRSLWYLHRDARVPARMSARALLSPFDSLIWQRDRVEALFGFHYRLEFYTPAARRIHGYYVMPLVWGDRLVARIDVKADRAAGLLRVQSVMWEDLSTARRTAAAQALLTETDMLADFLGLDATQFTTGLGL
ncbi:winged helix-turn-helix domain-containing protein [Austwickia sp. TVS 96-490-7B]|uniref:winged helix-turn-helix domain-containing protein n=1 Tax=Austwickia sp. TVS 96-490-7B TaxID=2830843 RepID=UPI0021074F59|nr:crosslink repair DNA glycosylase YcaQ family protein [Austwickia sp. TVS 96-490-7B]